MKMYKIIPLLVILVVCLCPRQVMAAEGTIRLELPEGAEQTNVFYAREGEEEKVVNTNGETVVTIPNLKEGTYQIRLQDTENYTFSETQVSVPMWSEEEHKMLYDITIIPKYNRIVRPPQTGDSRQGDIYAGIGLISLIIVTIISCHNRFKCGKIFGKYSN